MVRGRKKFDEVFRKITQVAVWMKSRWNNNGDRKAGQRLLRLDGLS